MTKPNKKPTNKELLDIMYGLHNQIESTSNAINVLGQTISDFIDFKKDDKEFLEYLKTKYKTDEKKSKE